MFRPVSEYIGRPVRRGAALRTRLRTYATSFCSLDFRAKVGEALAATRDKNHKNGDFPPYEMRKNHPFSSG
jgi:hypothetical protein